MLVCSNRPLSLSVPRFVTISSPYLSRPLLFSTTLYLIAFEAIEAFALSDARVTKLNTKLNNVKSYFLRSLKKKKKDIEFPFETFLNFQIPTNRRSILQISFLEIDPKFYTNIPINDHFPSSPICRPDNVRLSYAYARRNP